MLKAWQTVTDKFDDDTTSIVMAETRGQAIAATLASAHDAGWLNVKWGNIHAKRTPEFDSLRTRPKTPIMRCYAEYMLSSQQSPRR